MDTATRTQLIHRYKQGHAEVLSALDGITDAELDRRPSDNDWSPREIVHHLADSEMTSAIRLRRLIAEESPEIVGYDEEEFARRLFYDRPIEESLDALRTARSTSAEILERLGEGDWQRAGTHTEHGHYSIETWLQLYAAHAHDHTDQIRSAREAG